MFATFDCPHAVYIMVAAVVTLWQGYRGFRFQTLQFKPTDTSRVKRLEAVFLFYLADAFFYAVCSGMGFFALWVAYELIDHVNNLGDLNAGFGVVWVLMVAIGITGPTGQLPYLIQKMQPPWKV